MGLIILVLCVDFLQPSLTLISKYNDLFYRCSVKNCSFNVSVFFLIK